MKHSPPKAVDKELITEMTTQKKKKEDKQKTRNPPLFYLGLLCCSGLYVWIFKANTLQRRYNAVVGSHEHWPRYTWSALYVVRVIRNMTTTPTCTTAVSSSYYGILHIACMLYCMFLFYLFIFFFFIETLCMYRAWFPFYSFNPVNNNFFKLKLFCFFFMIIQGN